MEKKILILGATGRTGILAVKYALENGYSVNALVRNPNKIEIQSNKLKIIKGTPTNIEDLRTAMEGCNYVISLLSPLPESDSFSLKKITPPHFLEKSMQNVITVMKEKGIKRILTLSSIGVGDSHKYAPWFMRIMIKITNFRIVFDDHNKQETLIKNSNLEWTIARPVALNNNLETGTLCINFNKTPKPFKMSRKQLAMFFIDNLGKNEFIHKTPILSEK